MNTRWIAASVLALASVFAGCGGSTTDQDVAGSDATSDTGTTGTPLNGCADSMFTDLTAATATRTIMFDAVGTTYTPKCAQIAVGQTVAFMGPFTVHPLASGRAPSRPTTDTASATPTPIVSTMTGASASFTFPTAGDYGFYCIIHESLGMFGVIRVR